MDDRRNGVPYLAFEGEMARAERSVRRANINTIFALAIAALIYVCDRL